MLYHRQVPHARRARLLVCAHGLLLGLTISGINARAEAGGDRATGYVVDSMTTTLIREAQIPARDSGTLQSLDVTPGVSVKSGDVLGSLDDDRQAVALRAAELNLQIAQLKAENELPVETARAQIREAQQELAALQVTARISRQQAQSDIAVRLAEKTREVAQFELERARKARDAFSGSISSAEINRLQVLFDQKTLEIEKASEDRSISLLKPEADAAAVAQQSEVVQRSQLLADQQERELVIARVAHDVAANELELARLQLQRRRLVAPFDGTVVMLNHQPGEWVEAGTTVLKLVQLNRLRVDGFVDASVASDELAGRRVSIRFPANPELSEVPGIIVFVSPEIDPVNQQVVIRAEFDNPGLRIRPGLIASMRIGEPVESADTP